MVEKLILYPLRLLLEISCELRKRKEGYITPDELVHVIIRCPAATRN